MTMHVVLGDGAMTRREITEVLGDLWKADESQEQGIWFLLQGKSEPTETDTTLVTWLEKNEIYYEIVTDDPDSVSPIYSQPQDVHTAKKLPAKVISLLQTKPEGDEPAELLALFFDVNDPTAAEDRWLNAALQQVFDAGFPCRALNDGLVEIDLSEEAEAAEQEPEEEVAAPAPTKKVAKKVAAKPASPAAPPAEETEADIEADIAIPDEVPAPELAGAGEELPTRAIPTRDELEDMEPSEVKEVALALGIVLPPRTRATTYIDHILGEAKVVTPPVAEVSEIPDVAIVSTNGHIEADDIAERVADILWERFSKAFAQA